MSDSFEVQGSFSVLVEGEIEKPDGWDDMSEQQKRREIASQLSHEIEDTDEEVRGIDPSRSVVTEVLNAAEEMFYESAE